MAWQDKPTEAQVHLLRREYDALLYDRELEFPAELTLEAAKMIETRKEMSEEIDAARHGYVKSDKAREYIEGYFRMRKIKVDLSKK